MVPFRLALITASCGVTPQPQNTGTSSSLPTHFPSLCPVALTAGSPHSGLSISRIPNFLTASQPHYVDYQKDSFESDGYGIRTAIGSPCVETKGRVIPLTLSTSSALYGRIDTTHVPESKAPAGLRGTFVRYIGTVVPREMCLGTRPACSRAASKLKEHPIKKAT